MTATPPNEPLEALPMPSGSVVLPQQDGLPSGQAAGWWPRRLALAALRQAMGERQLALPLGPTIEPEDPGRLLSLNGFALQLVTTGISGDALEVPIDLWRQAATAPQLVLAACVDDENDVVHFPGVLTAQEFIASAPGLVPASGLLELDLEPFHGGVDRLLTLVQLLDPIALPRLAWSPAAPSAPSGTAVLDWLTGQVDAALAALGGRIEPISAGAFRIPLPVDARQPLEALAIVAIPLGLADDGRLVSGEAAQTCIERLQLLLIATGRDVPDGLRLRLVGDLRGDLLPDGLTLQARQGSHAQSITSRGSTSLELTFQGSGEPIQAELLAPSGHGLTLPPLQLPDA